jgi:hypothetical protein
MEFFKIYLLLLQISISCSNSNVRWKKQMKIPTIPQAKEFLEPLL